MKTMTATNVRADLFNILRQTVKGHLHTRISSREGAAVLLSEDDYESLLETAELLSISGLKKSLRQADRDIATGRLHSMDEAFK